MGVSVAFSHLRNCIRSRGFEFDDQTKRVEMWRLPGTTLRIDLPKKDWIPDVSARTILRQAGLTQQEIGEFLRHADTNCRN